jgi:hypothetical protein
MLAVATLSVLLAGGWSQQDASPPAPATLPAWLARAIASARTVGRGARYRPPASSEAVGRAHRVAGMGCSSKAQAVSVAHIELFAYEHVVIVPAGIGLAPPRMIRGARIVSARCGYPLRTLDPTGLVLLTDPRRTYRLGELFDLWGQTLNRTHIAGFQAPRHHGVHVYLDGKLWHGDPRDTPIAPHAEITVEVDGYVPPHASYSFPSLSWTNL